MAEHAPCNPGLDIHVCTTPRCPFKTQASPCAAHEYKTKHIQCHFIPTSAKGPKKQLLFENEQLLKIWKVLIDSESIAAPLNSMACIPETMTSVHLSSTPKGQSVLNS